VDDRTHLPTRVRYHGDPALSQQVDGSGDVNQAS
jgi:hypothetical protein